MKIQFVVNQETFNPEFELVVHGKKNRHICNIELVSNMFAHDIDIDEFMCMVPNDFTKTELKFIENSFLTRDFDMPPNTHLRNNTIEEPMTQKPQLWEIDKTFSFCYGHRVHSQILNIDYTEQGHTCAACRHLHGHEGKVQVFLSGDRLNQQGMVEDFVNLGWVKNFLDDTLDHKFILDINDPWFANIVNAKQNHIKGYFQSLTATQPLNTTLGRKLEVVPIYVPGTEYLVGHNVNVDDLQGPEKEFYEGFVFVNFVPTSENLAKWLFDAVDAKMSLIDVQVSKISWNETPKSRAVYSRPT